MGHIRRAFEKMQIEFTCINLRLCNTGTTEEPRRLPFHEKGEAFFVQDTLKGRLSY